MATIGDLLDDLPDYLAESVVKSYQHGNRSVTRQDFDKLVEGYLKLKQANEDSGSMASLGRVLPLT